MSQSMYLYVMLYVSSFFCVLGCDSWFLVWLGLELNMLSFIFIIFNRSLMEVESSLKYFFIQSVGSGMLLGAFYFDYKYVEEVFLMVLLYKVGGGPFFFWFPSLCEGISWVSCFFLMTMQSVMPFLLMSVCLSKLVWMMSLVSMMLGCVGAFNEISLKKLMAYSSVHHIGWMLVCLNLGYEVWVVYLLGYFIMLQGVIYLFYISGVLSIGEISRSKSPVIMCLMMLNMGGMPPMLGFFLKCWVFLVMGDFMMMVIVGMVGMSVAMLYVYVRVVYGVIMGEMMLFSGDRLVKNFTGWGVSFLILLGLMIGPIFGMFYV